MVSNPLSDSKSKIQSQESKSDSSPLLQLSEETPAVSMDLDERVLLGKETYTDPAVKKILLYLVENEKQELVPTYNPSVGFVYKTVDQILANVVSHQKPIDILNRLARLDILQKSFFDSVAACPNCQSTTITIHFRCPQCKSHHLFKTSLTEHIPCGFIAEKERYLQNKCPNCGNSISERDSRNLGSWYVCAECNEKFENAFLEYNCKTCGKTFVAEEAKMVELSKYSLNPKRKIEVLQGVASIENMSNLLKEIGFVVEMPGLAVGKQSGMEHQFSAIAKKQLGDKEIIATIEHSVGEPDVQASPLIVYIYKISEIEVDLPIFVAIPKLSESAKKIAQGRNILLVEGNPASEADMSAIRTRIESRLRSAEAPPMEEANMWNRPILKRDEQKPQLISVIPSIHPMEHNEQPKNSSLRGVFKKTFDKEKHKEQTS